MFESDVSTSYLQLYLFLFNHLDYPNTYQVRIPSEILKTKSIFF